MSDIIKITGTIEDFPTIQPGMKPDGVTPFKRITYKISGKIFSVFDNVIPNFEEFTKGNVVEVEYTNSPDKNNPAIIYNNMKKMTKVDNNTLPPAEPSPVPATNIPTSAPAKSTPYLDREKDTGASIVAQVIVKAATELVCSGKIEPGQIKANAEVLVDIYKKSKQSLLQ